MSNVASGHEYDAKSALATYQRDQSMVVVRFRCKIGYQGDARASSLLVVQSCGPIPQSYPRIEK